MVCWAPHGFASQVRAAHVLFRCPPGRDGAGPWSGGLGAAGAGGSRPAQAGGGGGSAGNCGPSSCGGGQCSVIAGGARGAASGPCPVASPGARWSCLGRENKTGPTPLRAPYDRMSQAHLRTCLRRHCLRALVKWPGARGKGRYKQFCHCSLCHRGSRGERVPAAQAGITYLERLRP